MRIFIKKMGVNWYFRFGLIIQRSYENITFETNVTTYVPRWVIYCSVYHLTISW